MIRYLPFLAVFVFISTPCYPRDKQQRIHLSAFKVLMDESEMEARSHLDMGVEETSDSGMRRCEILSPQNPRPSEKAWAPLDFYTQVKIDEVDNYKSQLGRPDLFFKGDDLNRNDAGDPHKLTRELAGSLKSSLDFLQKEISKSKDAVEVVVSFRRGPLKFDGLMRARAFEVSNGCDGALEYCTKVATVGRNKVCEPGGWTHRILEVSAMADVAGYLEDKKNEFFSGPIADRNRNDVKSLVASTVPADADPPNH